MRGPLEARLIAVPGRLSGPAPVWSADVQRGPKSASAPSLLRPRLTQSLDRGQHQTPTCQPSRHADPPCRHSQRRWPPGLDHVPESCHPRGTAWNWTGLSVNSDWVTSSLKWESNRTHLRGQGQPWGPHVTMDRTAPDRVWPACSPPSFSLFFCRSLNAHSLELRSPFCGMDAITHI